LAFALSFSPSIADSQTYSASIVGHVKDDQMGGLVGVNVSLSKAQSGYIVAETRTDREGRFQLVGLLAGVFDLDFALSGFQSTRLDSVEVRAHTTLEIDVSLARSDASAPKPSLRVQAGEVAWGKLFAETAFQRLPSTRTVWSLLENQEQSTITDVLDIGGLKVGRPALTGAHGASWTEVEYFLDGLNVTDPYIPGRPLLYPAFDDISTFEVITASKPASLSSSGVTLEIGAPQPAEDFHGAGRLFYSNHTLQSDNIDQRLKDFHFPGPERLEHLVDGEAQVGGKLPFNLTPWPVFGSFSTQNLEKSLGGFPEPIDAHVYSGLAKLTPYSKDPNQVDLLLAFQNVFNSREDADPKVEPAATTRGKNNLYQIQSRWRRVTSASSVFVLSFGVAHAITSSGLQPEAESISTINLPDISHSGSAELSTSGTRTRWELNALFELVHQGYVGNHSLDFGLDWNRSHIINSWDALGGIEQILIEGIGAEVIKWNTPAETRSHEQSISLFIQDAWAPLRWLQLPVGLRLETSSGKSEGAKNDISWATLEPRIGLVAQPIGDSVVVRASWSRYGHVIQGRYLDFGNVDAIGGEAFQWVDSNGDQQAQPAELVRLTRVFGGPHSAVDSGLSRPFTDEISFAIEHRLGRVLETHARFFRRDTHRIIRLDNQGLPASSYDPVSIVDPGNDGITGTTDDKSLTLFNEKETDLGKDFLVLINGPDGRGSYKGFEIGLEVMTSRGEFWASFAAMKTHAPTNPGNSVLENDMGVIGSLGTDPNTFLLDNSRTFFDRAYIGKMSGYYDGPFGLRVGAVAKYYDGLPFGRLLFVESLNQGPLFVRATPRAQPGGFRTEFNMTLDLRVARQFRLHRGSLEVYLDFFNLLNFNQNTVEASLTSPSFEMRVPLAIQAPRVTRLGLQWRF